MAVIGLTSTSGENQDKTFIFTTNVPLDSRVVVKNRVSLVAIATWTSYGFIYPGLICSVLSTQEIYIFKGFDPDNHRPQDFYTGSAEDFEIDGKLDPQYSDDSSSVIAKVDTYWTKLPSQDDLTKALETNKKELFTFKGVASAIDEDRCTITISGLKINNTTLTVDKQAYDLGMQTMFHWTSGGATPTYEFWTETSDGTGTQYTAIASTLVDYLIVQGIYYFKTDTTDVWESVDGVKIYEKSGSYYTDAVYTNSVVGTPGNYTGYQFTQKDPQQTVEAAGTTVKAEREGENANIGHVYQIGEEEYASNGSIWVQLGSPKEDWIVIK